MLMKKTQIVYLEWFRPFFSLNVDFSFGHHDPPVGPLHRQHLCVLGHQMLTHGRKIVTKHLQW